MMLLNIFNAYTERYYDGVLWYYTCKNRLHSTCYGSTSSP